MAGTGQRSSIKRAGRHNLQPHFVNPSFLLSADTARSAHNIDSNLRMQTIIEASPIFSFEVHARTSVETIE